MTIVLALLATQSRASDQTPILDYQVVQKYGWEDISQSSRPLSAKERKLEGGMLGTLGNFAVGPDGRLYVPDGMLHKVVVFERSGALVDVWGGEGDGPGELRVPASAAVSPDGIVYIHDRKTKKVTVFSREGKYRTRFQFPGEAIGNLAWSSGSLFAARWAPENGTVLISMDPSTGIIRDSSVTLSRQETQLYKNGSSVIVHASNRGVYVGSPNPGVWYSAVGSSLGRYRSPQARAYTRTMGNMPGVRATTDRMIAFALRRDGAAAIVYVHRTKLAERSGESVEEATFLEVVRPNGSSEGRFAFPKGHVVHGLAVDGQDVLVGVMDDIPQIWRLRSRGK